MKVVACLTRFQNEWTDLISLMEQLEMAVVTHHSPDDLLQNLGQLDPDLFLVDARASRNDIETLVELASPSATLIVVAPQPQRGDTELVHVENAVGVYDTLSLADRPSHQRRVIQRSAERASLVRKDVHLIPPREAAMAPSAPVERRSQRPWEMALRSLSRTLSVGLDSRELIQPFLDLAMELSGVARAALLTPESGTTHFRVTASRGLHGAVLRSYPHPRQSGLINLLVNEGRPLRRDDYAIVHSPQALDIQRSFDALQATVCIPMAARSQLLGVLGLGTRINGHPPMDEQLEILFTIGSHVAVAIQNAMLHEETSRQKVQDESVLEHMTNGVAAINEAGVVTVFNRRAAEILHMTSQVVGGRDLRALPAPLGDFLYGAMRSGEAMKPAEVVLSGLDTPVEVSTYPLFIPDSPTPVGSVLVLEDISQRLELAETQRHADRQEVFHRLVSQLAHELKNPLVAVKTFADLYPEHADDPDFARFVYNSVIPEIGRLDEIVGKLAEFFNPNVLEMRVYPLEPILEDIVQRIAPEAAAAHVRVALTMDDDLPGVRADRALLSKALCYLLRHLVANVVHTEDEARIQIRAINHNGTAPLTTIEFACDRPWTHDQDVAHLFDPLHVNKEQLNLALPVARKIIQEHRGDVEAVSAPGDRVDLRVLLHAVEAGERVQYTLPEQTAPLQEVAVIPS